MWPLCWTVIVFITIRHDNYRIPWDAFVNHHQKAHMLPISYLGLLSNTSAPPLTGISVCPLLPCQSSDYCSITIVCNLVKWPSIAERNNASVIANPLQVQP